MILLAVIVAAHGVRGAVKVKSFTDSPKNIFAYGPLRDEKGHGYSLELIREAPANSLIVTVEGVSDRNVDQRVIAMTRFGGYADTVCVDASQTFQMPEAMSFEEGAALPVTYLTAYHMLFNVFRVRAGDHVLIHQAAGGVGTAASQLCRSVGGVTTYGTASKEKHDYVRSNGCQYPID